MTNSAPQPGPTCPSKTGILHAGQDSFGASSSWAARWLDKHERRPDENPPLGLVLCADKNEEQIELLELTEGNVRVATYLTELPPRQLLERKLLESIERARARALALPAEERRDASLAPAARRG